MLEYYSSYQHGTATIQSSHLIPGLLSLQTLEVSTKFLGTYHNIQGRSKLTGGLIWIMNFADKLPNFRWTHSVWALVYESIDFDASSKMLWQVSQNFIDTSSDNRFSDIAIDISELIVFHSGQTVRLTFSSRKWFKYSFERGWAGSGPFHERMMDN